MPTGGRGKRRSGQRGLRAGEQGTRGAARIVERGRGEAGGGGTRRIIFFRHSLFFLGLSFVFLLSYNFFFFVTS